MVPSRLYHRADAGRVGPRDLDMSSLAFVRSVVPGTWRYSFSLRLNLCMPGYLANDCQGAIGGSTLLHKRDSPGGLRSSACLGIVMDAQDHNGALGDHPAQGCGGLDAIHLRHLDI